LSAGPKTVPPVAEFRDDGEFASKHLPLSDFEKKRRRSCHVDFKAKKFRRIFVCDESLFDLRMMELGDLFCFCPAGGYSSLAALRCTKPIIAAINGAWSGLFSSEMSNLFPLTIEKSQSK
jgi:hypothetical protein